MAIQVGFVQISNVSPYFLPYSVGLLQAYAQTYARDPRRYEFLLPIYSRVPVGQALAGLAGVKVAGFSAYVWNIQRSLMIAQNLKLSQPDTLIVFGGPQVPDAAEAFLREHPYVDICCHGPGEATFLALLESYPERVWEELAGVSYLDPGGNFCHRPPAPRLKALDFLPSPYLNGVFEPLMRACPGESWAALWETNRGCPFSCSFCDWGSAVQSKVYTFSQERLVREIAWFGQQGIGFVFCCDANFGLLQRDEDIVQELVRAKHLYGYPRRVATQNAKNVTERAYQIQKALFAAGLSDEVTLSLQSVDPQTLTSIRRQNISLAFYQELQRRFTRDGVPTYTDVLIGLPGETYASFADGVASILANGQHRAIKFYNVGILPNAEMGDPQYQQRYGLEIVRAQCVYLHAPVQVPDDHIDEMQELVIATAAMPRPDWARARALAWMTDFLFYGQRLLQLPLVLLHGHFGIAYRDLLELFTDIPDQGFPVLAEVQGFFLAKAREIQQAGFEYCQAEGVAWEGIWWSADEFMLRQLLLENRLAAFFAESEAALALLLARIRPDFPPRLLHEALLCSTLMLKLRFTQDPAPVSLALSYNLWEFYQGALSGLSVPLELKEARYLKDWAGDPYVMRPAEPLPA